jgi:hypothetical protein
MRGLSVGPTISLSTSYRSETRAALAQVETRLGRSIQVYHCIDASILRCISGSDTLVRFLWQWIDSVY